MELWHLEPHIRVTDRLSQQNLHIDCITATSQPFHMGILKDQLDLVQNTELKPKKYRILGMQQRGTKLVNSLKNRTCADRLITHNFTSLEKRRLRGSFSKFQ